MKWIDLIHSRNVVGCRSVLSTDTSAVAAFTAVSLLCTSSFDPENPFFEDGDLIDFDSFETIVRHNVGDTIDPDNIHRAYGLLTAVSNDLFFEDPDHFISLVGAIVYGDPYRFDDEDPLLTEMVWALFQVDMMLEESAEELLNPRVGKRIIEISEDNPADLEKLREIEPTFMGNIEEFYDELLRFRKIDLQADLSTCGVPDAVIEELGLDA